RAACPAHTEHLPRSTTFLNKCAQDEEGGSHHDQITSQPTPLPAVHRAGCGRSAAAARVLPHGWSGSISDVKHVVILMQENRSFDHYFGTLRGVRGYGDPRVIDLPSGQPVWNQPAKEGVSAVSPFHLDTSATRAETMFSLDHSWKGSHAAWKHHDAWIPAKGPLTMGYFTRADIPFYYALADAFTICDAYHCS